MAQPIRMFAAAAPQEFGQRQTRVLEIGLLDAASYRSASRTTFRTAEGPLALLALWKNGREDALRASKSWAVVRQNPFCPPARAQARVPVHSGVISAPANTSAMEENHHSHEEGILTRLRKRAEITA